MQRILIYFVIMLICAGLSACGQREESAREPSGQAKAVATSPDPADGADPQRPPAEEISSARAAEQPQAETRRQRKAQQKAALAAVESIQNVVESYQLVYHRWPQSIRDIDDGDYLFDSDYMADSVAAGYEVYLAWTVGETGYRLWIFPEGEDFGFLQAGKGQALVGLSRERAMAEIEEVYAVEQAKGGLTFLLPRG